MIDDSVRDNGLSSLNSGTYVFHICSQEPSTYSEVATYSLGNKTNPSLSTPENATPSGRRIRMSSFLDGNCTASGDPTHWALIRTSDTTLISTGTEGTANLSVDGATFSFSEVDVVRML